jgi:exoribonuclease-2
MDTEPAYHSGLGLNAYTTLTSPLRRALDLIMQKQLSYFFHTGKPLFNKDDLAKYLLLLQDGLLTASQITQARNRYWILKFFTRMINIPLNAWFLENIQNKALVVLDDYLITVELPRQGDMKLMFGDPMKVIIKRSIPRENILKADWPRE